MSSGGFVFPIVLPLAALNASLDMIRQANDEIRETNLAAAKLSDVCRETERRLQSLQKTLDEAKNMSASAIDTGASVSISGVSQVATDDSVTGFSVDDLFLTDLNIDTQEITYVVFDYSEALAVNNARNSNEYKKLSLASELNKRLLLLPVDKKNKESIAKFVDVMNTMLDDEKIDFDYFKNYILKRFEGLVASCERAGIDITSKEWLEYCAACALVGETPQLLSGDALKKKTDEYSRRALISDYITAGRKAFKEVLEELEMEVIGDYELEEVEGVIVGESEDAGYKFFISQDDENFTMEMIEEKGATPQEKVMACLKRKKIERLMEEKGFPIQFVAEDDDGVVSAAYVSKPRTARGQRMADLSRKRAVSGAVPKVKKIGE